MNTIKNSYFFGRVVVWFRTGSTPSVTIASSTVHVNEMAYRTSPVRDEWISRHYSEVVNLETFQVECEKLDRIRLILAQMYGAVCANADESINQNSGSSSWFLQPRDDGWLAMYNGRQKDIRAFKRWLSDVLT